MKFGFIGAGNMVSAIVKGMTANGYDGKNIFITSKTVTSAAKLAEACGANSCQTAGEVIAQSDVVVLGVKPHILAEILPGLQGDFAAKKPLVVSIAAGKTLEYLAEHLPKDTPIVRVMPNINAKIGASTTGICHNDAVTAEQLAAARELAEKLGKSSITVSIKAGEGGKAFGSVSSKEIASAIASQLSLDIDKKTLVLPEPLKTFGVHEVPIKLHKEVTGKLAVKVVES